MARHEFCTYGGGASEDKHVYHLTYLISPGQKRYSRYPPNPVFTFRATRQFPPKLVYFIRAMSGEPVTLSEEQMGTLVERLSDKLVPILSAKLPPPPGRALEESEKDKAPGMLGVCES